MPACCATKARGQRPHSTKHKGLTKATGHYSEARQDVTSAHAPVTKSGTQGAVRLTGLCSHRGRTSTGRAMPVSKPTKEASQTSQGQRRKAKATTMATTSQGPV